MEYCPFMSLLLAINESCKCVNGVSINWNECIEISGSFIKAHGFVIYAGIIAHEAHDKCQIVAVKQCCNLLFRWVNQILQ